jgi:two-component system, NtrC family, nitrogen regulation response regulator GlnG
MKDQAAGRVLVVDDEGSIRFVLGRALEQAGLTVAAAENLAGARRHLAEASFEVVLLDVRLPDGSGLDLLPEIVAGENAPQVVVMTARESMDVAVEAMKAGARDFVVKPFDLDRLTALMREIVARPRVGAGAAVREAVPESLTRPGRLLGRSPAMVEVFKTIGRIAPADVTVLVRGESGTGKELVARAIHDNSPRASGPFITVNCAAIPHDLMESELFGHERGSFTGALERRRGKFELADGGTLFLDEIGELPLPLQAKLLRVLQERVIERVGGATPIPVDVRIVAATHRDLARLVTEGAFREDLFYRLDVVPILLPPLRERPDDVRLLSTAFVARWGPELTGHPVSLDEEAVALLESHPWPGNVRELENVIKRALLLQREETLTAGDLSGAMMPGGQAGALPAGRLPGGSVEAAIAEMPLETLVEARLRPFLERLGDRPPEGLHDVIMQPVERALLRVVLEHAGGNQLEAARILGINRNTLRKRLRELDVPLPERRRNRRSR